MKNFDQFEISTIESNNVEGGTFGLLGLFGNCLPKPTCSPVPTCPTPTPPPCYTAPKPTCPPVPTCPPPTTNICKPTISFSFSFSLGGCKPVNPCLPS